MNSEKKKKSLLIVLSVVFSIVLSGLGTYALADVINNFYGNTTINQQQATSDQGESLGGAVTAIAGVCSGSEPVTQMCNVGVSNLDISGSTTINDLSVTGTFAFDDPLTLNKALSAGAITGSSTLAITGSSTLKDLSMNGLTVSQTLAVTGSSTMKDITMTDLTVNQTLAVTGASTLTGNATLSGSTTAKDISMTDLTVNHTLAVTGASTLTGNATMAGTLGIGTTTPSGTLQVASQSGTTTPIFGEYSSSACPSFFVRGTRYYLNGVSNVNQVDDIVTSTAPSWCQ